MFFTRFFKKTCRDSSNSQDVSKTQNAASLHLENGAMKIVVGLGNPGVKYRANRHNVGYMILSELAAKLNAGSPKARFHADTIDLRVQGEPVLLLCPTTFMNRSGTSVQEASRFYKVEPENIFVVCDDLDLPFEKLRIRAEGGSGGQNGLRDIARVLGTQKFPRLRFGIGRPPGNMDPANYVLMDFKSEEKKILPFALKTAADAVECFLTQGINEAMNRYNSKTGPER